MIPPQTERPDQVGNPSAPMGPALQNPEQNLCHAAEVLDQQNLCLQAGQADDVRACQQRPHTAPWWRAAATNR